MLNSSVADKTRDWYRRYYEKKGVDRNDLLCNPEVLFQALAFDASVISALRSIHPDRVSIRILDVGCGTGDSILNFLKVGFDASRIYGIDILEELISVGRARFPNVNLTCEDASNMKFTDASFDLVFEGTMFVQISDESVARKIADEMLRVTKLHGFIVLADWRWPKPGDTNYKALSMKRIVKLFHVGTQSRILGVHKGALIPPIGRFLSSRLPFAYFSIAFILPFLVGQVTTVLKKEG